MSRRIAQGPANWKITTGPLTDEQASRRWIWILPSEEAAFEELVDRDLDAYIELSARIEAATKGLLPPGDTSIAIVNHPLGRRRNKWPDQTVPWIAEWKEDAHAGRGCHRVYFADALGEHDGVEHQMLGLLYRYYPERSLKESAQTRDIEVAIAQAIKHEQQHGCCLRSFPP